jgi:hypothetical protein
MRSHSEVCMDKLYEEIAQVAYELYEKRGRCEGCHFDDWLEAEKIVMARHAERAQKPAGPVKKKAAVKTPKRKDAEEEGKATPKKRTNAGKTAPKKKKAT